MLKKEPILALATLVAAVLAVVGVSISADTVFVVISAVLPLVAGIIGRQKVTPVVETIEAKVEKFEKDVTAAQPVTTNTNPGPAPAAPVVVPPAEPTPPVDPSV